MTIDKTLEQRGNRYGDFVGHAQVTQRLKRAMRSHAKYGELPNQMQEALEMIQHKIGRIINGDPNYKDSWTDIIGYARLIEKDLKDDH